MRVYNRALTGAEIRALFGPTCVDGVKNFSETDLDCGGLCGDCADGAICVAATDCRSGLCRAGRCHRGLVGEWTFNVDGMGQTTADSSGFNNTGVSQLPLPLPQMAQNPATFPAWQQAGKVGGP